MTAPSSDVRINARLSGPDAARFRELLDRSGGSASDLLRDALREYHATHVQPRRDPLDLLAGYIGAGDGPEDLSAGYKTYLADALEEKLPLRVQDRHDPD
ncbi:ribbon-helix-helix domain-containing protein [Luteimonas sp. gir]|uniref:ribbon-helix-helix domain-containing protein n=1 Tax=Luteimonas sp. gir TaxID=3127960 RepID=UPI003075AFDD